MQLVHPPLTLVAATISALLAGPVLAAPTPNAQGAVADETLTVLGQTYRNTATKTRLDPIETPQAISVEEGETLEQRELGITMELIALQVKSALAGVPAEKLRKCVIAYEPIWAIGTGKTATAEQAAEVCTSIRTTVRHLYGARIARSITIQYGGSMKPGNAAELLAQPDIDGGLIGGAALKPADFVEIINAANQD